MKLELKHIPQIAYGLEIQILNSKCDYVGIERAKVNGHYYIGDVLYLKYEGGSTGKSQNECKPILRPLSDLTKSLYWELSGKSEEDSFAYWYVEKNASQEIGIHFEGYSSRRISLSRIDLMPYYTLCFLFENHFDVFGLIREGLAIDINTL